MGEVEEAFDGDGDDEEAEEHHGREEEDAAEGVAGRGVAEQEDLREGPAEAGEEGRRDDEGEAEGGEIAVRLAGDHHDDAGGHGRDDEDELERGGFEAEEEREEEDEGEGGGFAHCWKGLATLGVLVKKKGRTEECKSDKFDARISEANI